MTPIALTLTPVAIETIVACLASRARLIGGDTRADRIEQERLYGLIATIDLQLPRSVFVSKEE